jgi:hypothetical protein
MIHFEEDFASSTILFAKTFHEENLRITHARKRDKKEERKIIKSKTERTNDNQNKEIRLTYDFFFFLNSLSCGIFFWIIFFCFEVFLDIKKK